MSREVKLKVVREVPLDCGHVAVVRPGDTLIVAVHDGLTLAQVDEWRARLAERLTGVTPLIVAANALAVYRPDSTGEEHHA